MAARQVKTRLGAAAGRDALGRIVVEDGLARFSVAPPSKVPRTRASNKVRYHSARAACVVNAASR